MAAKQGLGIDVLSAARLRMDRVFEDFPRVYVSFSGGKDSTALLHLAAEAARRRGRRFGLLLVDLEAQYRLTIEHALQMFALYADVAEPYWVSLPLNLRNAVSQFEPQWRCWDPERERDWVRRPPPLAITDEARFPFFRRGMEFEEFVPAFGQWYAGGRLCACLVGIRCDESLNRWRTIARQRKQRFEGLAWTTRVMDAVYNAYPLYDWRTKDVWVYHGRTRLPYNGLYDRMHMAGLSIHQQRICQPYGDDQRKGLWLYHIIEPETWGRVVARVNGANQGALYARESGNALGNLRITLPEGHTWESFAHMILDTLPPPTAEHYRNKIAVFLKWYEPRGYGQGIPDDGPANDRTAPSWKRVCKALLRNDYWCKGLSFSQHRTAAYDNYLKLMKRRRREWNLI